MTTGIENPWQDIPDHPPFVAPSDTQILSGFDSELPDFELHLDLMPLPWLGAKDAPIVLLNLNPGYDEIDLEHETDRFTLLAKRMLAHEPINHPFFLLDPGITAPGNAWWSKRLRILIERVGLEAVTGGVLCLEYFPYHSKSFKKHQGILPSQHYTFQLLRNAMDRGAIVVALRSLKFWQEPNAVPELGMYPNLFKLKNPQSVYLTPNNCPSGFHAIVDRLSNINTRTSRPSESPASTLRWNRSDGSSGQASVAVEQKGGEHEVRIELAGHTSVSAEISEGTAIDSVMKSASREGVSIRCCDTCANFKRSGYVNNNSDWTKGYCAMGGTRIPEDLTHRLNNCERWIPTPQL